MATEQVRDGRRRPEAGGDPAPGDDMIGAREAAQEAASYLEEMTGQPPEAVIATEPSDAGWLVTVEVLELSRVPETTDVLASYEVEIDAGGEPLAYRRSRRYLRGWVGEE